MADRYLLDTMVVSENFKRTPAPGVVDWLTGVRAEDIAVSVITLGEIAAGIEKQRHGDAAAFQRLSDWLLGIQVQFASRTLPISTGVALRWGPLSTRLKRRDIDLLIAATALEHDLTVVTRNIRHFEPTGVKLLNPYGA